MAVVTLVDAAGWRAGHKGRRTCEHLLDHNITLLNNIQMDVQLTCRGL